MKIQIPTYKQFGQLARKRGMNPEDLFELLPTDIGGPKERMKWAEMVLRGIHPSRERKHADDLVPWLSLCRLFTQWKSEEKADDADKAA